MVEIEYFVDTKTLKDSDCKDIKILREHCDMFNILPNFWNRDIVEIDLGQGKITVNREAFEKELNEYKKRLQELEIKYHIDFLLSKLKTGSK